MIRARRVVAPVLAPVLALALSLTSAANGAPAPSPAAGSRVDRVVVYSDQARVVRRVAVKLDGSATEVLLADLPGNVDPDSVRVAGSTIEVERVTLSRSRERSVEQKLAKELAERAEKAQDALELVRDEEQVYELERTDLDGLGLHSPKRGPRDRVPDALFAGAFAQVLRWMEGRLEKLERRLVELRAQRKGFEAELHRLRVQARGAKLDATDEPVVRVAAALKGAAGRHELEVSYRVEATSWVPSYDLRYDARRREVEATYYAVVRQRSGESWPAARLRFSTLDPEERLAVPELPTLLLGHHRLFVPTPRPRSEEVAPRWSPPEAVTEPAAEHREWPRRAVDGKPDAAARTDDDRQRAAQAPRPAPAPSPPSAPGGAFSGKAEASGEVEASSRRAPARESVGLLRESVFAGRASSTGASAPAQTLPWDDTGYRPRVLDRDLPAAAARGYRFTLYAPGQHSVPATGEPRRVPLLTRRFAVRPVYRIAAALAPRAYLTAEVPNRTGQPILRGHAHLFSGSLFSGRTWLNTALPGESVFLPLGVDDQIKIVRRVEHRTLTKGLVFKDDVTEYTVEVELANHRGYGVEVLVEDQVPVKLGRRVEVTDFASPSGFSAPDARGHVRYRGTVPAGSVRTLSFRFRLVRPRDWQVHQVED
ncbi:MAG: DUF4139 domain-containing protein [Deltaproteobacteria bacterium]|nr:DUF4139 domain-containing protein [Deltaproteobacteria bacterium]